MRIDPKTCKVYGKLDIVGRDAPEYLVDFLKRNVESALNRMRKPKDNAPLVFTEHEQIALAITFGRDHVEFDSGFDHVKGEIIIETQRPIRVTADHCRLNIEIQKSEIYMGEH